MDMLSNPPRSIQARQRQHRRQNSTPSALQGADVSSLPNANLRRSAAGHGHRRGLSLDLRRQQMASPITRQQDFNKVRMTTNNTGLATTSQHQILRESQQQRIQARPGPQQLHYASMAPNENEGFLASPHGTPQTPRFDTSSCFDTTGLRFCYNGPQWNMMMQKNQESFANNMAESKSFDMYSNDSALSTPTFMNFSDSPAGPAWSADDSSSRRSSRRISNGIMDRVNKFENLGMEDPERPTTPTHQNGANLYPPTPMETPHDRMMKQDSRPDRFSEDYDESMEETIKPNRNKRTGPGAQSVFADMRRQAEHKAAGPSPPTSSKIPDAKTFASLHMQNQDCMNLNVLRNEFIKIEDQQGISNYEPGTTPSASDLSHHTSPEAEAQHAAQFSFENVHNLQASSNCSSPRVSAHRRTESVASMASAASIADINIDETRTDTGVTLEEISQYILSPETTDGKWTCLFEDCGKKFGRKENIKSHVQTHLNDRQYQCPTCQKCFVRQHDLKRHAKIHTGIKPYPCECGNSFARHDALTRHRQRGMCIGAFDGVVRKVVKRGRPRKNRPDMETRMEKSAKTRRKNNMSISSVSSFSGYSDCSSTVNSPENDMDMLDDMVELSLPNMNNSNTTDGRNHAMPSMSSAPMPSLAPRHMGREMVQSPAVVCAQSYVSPEAIMDRSSSHPTSPAKSGVSHYNTPPELSQSSSPPPTGRFFEISHSAPARVDDLAVMSSANGMMDSTGMNGTLPIGMATQDDDLLLQFSQDDGLVQLDRDSSMLMMTKFDEEFDAAVSMFTNNDDMFFGST